MKRIWIVLTLSTLIVSCQEQNSQTFDGFVGYVEPAALEETQVGLPKSVAAPTAQAQPADDRKIIKTITLSLGVDEPAEVAARVQQIAEARGGYVAGLTSSNREGRHYQITMRVPVETVTEVMAEIKGLATVVDHENLSSRDVTDHFVDLEARVRALVGTERELMSLLAESRSRNHKVKDIMDIYRELTQVRSEIERFQGQINVLENQSSLATVEVRLRPVGLPTVPAVEQWQPLVTFRDSYRVLVGVFQGVVDAAIVTAVVLIPLLLAGVLGLWLLWKSIARVGGRLRSSASTT